MSIAAYTPAEAAVAAQAGPPVANRKPPPKRVIVAVADVTQPPEPR